MNASNSNDKSQAEIAVIAGEWVARRDRGLTAAEQDSFLQWLAESPRHRAAIAHLDRTWSALDTLAVWQPEHSARPNPDLLAPARPRNPIWVRAGLVTLGLAAAAWGLLALREPAAMPESGAVAQGLRIIPAPEPQLLPDGSIAEVNHGGRYTLAFTPTERRLRLWDGELHVTVEKDPARPFIVEVDRVEVRAVGTAFNVRRERGAVEVLVTEGQVQLEIPPAAEQPVAPPVPVSHGERARVTTGAVVTRPVVRAASADEVARELVWQGVRLEFEALPLASVVAEFNLRNVRQLKLADAATAQVRVQGTFRADQVDAFVRLLEASFGIVADRRAEGPWILRRAVEAPTDGAPSRQEP